MVTAARLDRHLLPSISMLAAFDATARTGSFSAAARELDLTHGAVSRQVAALELKLGVALFDRSAHGESLTACGEQYAREIRAVLTTLQSASSRVSAQPSGNTLNLAIPSTFGTRWLMPRLPGFIGAHRDITVNIVTRLAQADLVAEAIDTAICYDVSELPDTEAIFLLDDELIPVCAPALAPLARNMRDGELGDLKLLHVRSRTDAWDDWFALFGRETPEAARSLVFQQFSVAAEAAVAGLGVAILPRSLVARELERSELVCLDDRALVSAKGLYLVTPQTRTEYGPVVAFREWLLETIEREKGAAARPPV